MASIGALTQGIARVLRGKLAEAQQNTTWFGNVIGVSQSQASKILRGTKPITLDQLSLACDAFGLRMSEVIMEAEGSDSNDGNHAPSTKII